MTAEIAGRRALHGDAFSNVAAALSTSASQRWRPTIFRPTGWPTFPMVFAKGVLVGGAQDLDKLVSSGELQRLLGS